VVERSVVGAAARRIAASSIASSPRASSASPTKGGARAVHLVGEVHDRAPLVFGERLDDDEDVDVAGLVRVSARDPNRTTSCARPPNRARTAAAKRASAFRNRDAVLQA
jgi:hypothetical protein